MSTYNPNMPCALPFMFDPTQYEIMGAGGDFIKQSGKYPLVVDNVEMCQVKGNAAAHYLAVTFRITGGELKDSKFIERFNINNPSDTAREIAIKKLTSLATATGIRTQIADARVFVGKALQAFVKAESVPSTTDPNKTNWNNEIAEWFYADGNSIVRGQFGAAGGAAPQTNFAPATNNAPPAPQGNYAAPPSPQGNFAPQPQQTQQQTPPPAQQGNFAPPPQGNFAPPPAAQTQIDTNVAYNGGQQQQQQTAPQGNYAPPAAQNTGGFTPPPAPQFAPPPQN